MGDYGGAANEALGMLDQAQKWFTQTFSKDFTLVIVFITGALIVYLALRPVFKAILSQ